MTPTEGTCSPVGDELLWGKAVAASPRGFGVLASAHGRLVLLAGAAALGCATGCASGGASAQSAPSGAAADHLYWPNSHNGTIVETSLDGTHATTIAKGQHPPAGVAVDGSHLN